MVPIREAVEHKCDKETTGSGEKKNFKEVGEKNAEGHSQDS